MAVPAVAGLPASPAFLTSPASPASWALPALPGSWRDGGPRTRGAVPALRESGGTGGTGQGDRETGAEGTGPGNGSGPAHGDGGDGGDGGEGGDGGTRRRLRPGGRERNRRRAEEGAANPFAAPPEGRPDQEWRPRGPGVGDGRGDGGRNGGEDAGGPEDGRRQPPWAGARWSPRQPGRQSGGFGGRPDPGRGGGPGGNGGPSGPRELRWDPTDPNQRRARYALVSGMWGFILALFGLPEIGMLLGALALYWGISSLRGTATRPGDGEGEREGAGKGEGRTGRAMARPEDVSGPADARPGPARPADQAPATGAQGARSQRSAAVSGLVTGSLALVIVATTYTFQLVYRDYYTCVQDALTTPSRKSCEQLLPERLRPFLGSRD
ncbi:hypothetical protein [Streptomyces zingiberis]|uniref:Integral membrane protein n=1 Tax=Streptomyces zingiberis TaxID=2053010 RepID=A0ABX1BY93_9ACTN|nr:hypothetical protein [Streptomyces zingiberis]NJQ00682.1 hypothetical protein [Streptomyces zingiberis]